MKVKGLRKLLFGIMCSAFIASGAIAYGLTLVASNVDYSAGYDFTEDGAYTLEYVANDGMVAYKSDNVVYDPITTSTKIGEVTVNDLTSTFVFEVRSYFNLCV